MSVFHEMLIVQILILLTLWGFAIDMVRRRRGPKPPATPKNAGRTTIVLVSICGAVVLFVVVIVILALVTQ